MVDDPRAASSGAPRVGKVGVIGAGLIGGSIARACLEAGVAVSVVDRDPAVADQAERAGARSTSLAGLAEDGEVVFLCPPPNAVASVWRDWCNATEGSGRDARSIVLDVASVKRPVRDGVAELGMPWATDDAVFVLSHPMAGRERTGWNASDPALFRGATWVLMPPEQATGAEVARSIAAVEALGATVCFMDPTFHDRFAGLTSHVAHALAFVFQAQVDAIDPAGWRRFSGNSLRDLLRVATSDHDLWTEILAGNEQELRPLLQDLAARLEDFDPARDIPVEPPRDPVPDATGPDGRPFELTLAWDEPLGEHRSELLATGERGLHLDDVEVDAVTGGVRLRFGAPIASTS